MAEENDGDNTIPPETMEPESVDMTKNSRAPTEEASDNIMAKEKTGSHIEDEKNSDGLHKEEGEDEEDSDGLPKEEGEDLVTTSDVTSPPEETSEGEDLRSNSDILEGMIGNTSLPEGTTDAVVEEEGEDLRTSNDDIGEGMIGNTFSPKETDFADGDRKNNSTAIIIGSNHKFKVRSRYMTSSVGSCHDLCKFGHKHEAEKKPRRPSLGTIRESKPLTRTTSDDLAKFVALKEEPKKKDLVRRLSLPGQMPEKKPPSHAVAEDTNRSKKDINQLKLKRIQSEIKPSSVPTSARLSTRSKSNIEAGKKAAVRSSNVAESSTHRVKEIKTTREGVSNSKGEKEKAKEPMSNSPSSKMKEKASEPMSNSPSSKTKEKAKEPMSSSSLSPKTPLKRSPSVRARLYKNLKNFSHSKKQSNSEEAKVNGGGSDDVPEKVLHMIEPNTNKKPTKKASKTTVSKESLPNTPKRSKANRKGRQNGLSSSSSSVPPASTAEEPSQPQGEDQQGLPSINTKKNAMKKEDGGSKANTPRAKPTGDQKMKVKTGLHQSEERESSPWKVKFRRGTMIALQVANNAPKKLRFKRSKALAEDQNAKDGGSKSLKNREQTGDEPHETKPEGGKVQLRHQEASEKKDNVDLNNVIEETASKLVKTRKSKVKALVGAFETVMSLHDRKAMVESGAS